MMEVLYVTLLKTTLDQRLLEFVETSGIIEAFNKFVLQAGSGRISVVEASSSTKHKNCFLSDHGASLLRTLANRNFLLMCSLKNAAGSSAFLNPKLRSR